jgi:hypothetical protein
MKKPIFRGLPRKKLCFDCRPEPVNERQQVTELDRLDNELDNNCERAHLALGNWQRLFIAYSMRKGF